jgi:hypothetical protein
LKKRFAAEMKKRLLLAASLPALITTTGSAFAQATDRDHPTPFTSDEILTGILGMAENLSFQATSVNIQD